MSTWRGWVFDQYGDATPGHLNDEPMSDEHANNEFYGWKRLVTTPDIRFMVQLHKGDAPKFLLIVRHLDE